MLKPEEIRKENTRLNTYRKRDIPWSSLPPFALKASLIIAPILTLAVWSELSYKNTSDIENPTVYACILYLVIIAAWGIPKLVKLNR